MDFGVFVSILFSCFPLFFAKSIAKFDPSKLSGTDWNAQPFPSSPDRTLKNAILQDTVFVAHPDGSLYNVDTHSGDVKWVFSTGEPLWSSSQPFSLSESHSNYDYIDVEDDTTFVVKGSDGKVKHKLADSAAQLLSKLSFAPDIFDRQIVIGSRRTEVYILNADSGRRVSVHNLAANRKDEGNANHESLVESNVVETGGQICVIRTTYCFQSLSRSGEPRWDLNYSEYSIVKHSQGFDDVISRNSMHTRNGQGLDYKPTTFEPFLIPMPSFSWDHSDADEQHAKAKQESYMTMQHKLALPGPNTGVKSPK